jgi:hypothetical protein
LTPSDKIKKASTSIIVERLSKAWKKVPVNCIPKSFLEYCLSNAEDGMQNGILWDDNEQNSTSSSENESATEGLLDKFSD